MSTTQNPDGQAVASAQTVVAPQGEAVTPNEKTIAHLEVIREDLRSEIKDRIKQRDAYSIQLTISLGAIVAVAFAPPGFTRVLIAAPLVSIYFTVLILYSYRVHTLVAQYLREQIEPELARLCGMKVKEWEEYYYSQKAVPGIRKRFFLGALWVVTALSLVYLGLTQGSDPEFAKVLVFMAFIYGAVVVVITAFF